jgi:phosphoribosylformylglycinamidine synthase
MTVRGFETANERTVEHSQFGGFPELGDLDAERQLADVLVGAAAERLLDGARDVDLDPFEAVFSDSNARAVVAGRVRRAAGAGALPSHRGSVPMIGITGGDALHVGDLFDVRLDERCALHEATLPVAFER